jgi:hypothetical protein
MSVHDKGADEQSTRAPGHDARFVFERQGARWRISFEGVSAITSHLKGLVYYAKLLEKPDQAIEALVLEGHDLKKIPISQGREQTLSGQTIANYKARLAEIDGKRPGRRRGRRGPA